MKSKTKKILLVILALVTIATFIGYRVLRGLISGVNYDEHGCNNSAGFFWCERKQKCLEPVVEPCENETAFYELQKIKKLIPEINFLVTRDTELTWYSENEVEKYNAKYTMAKRVEPTDADKVTMYFKNNNYTSNIENLILGTISGSSGFSKNNIKCIYEVDHTNYVESDENLVDIKISCTTDEYKKE